MYETQNDISNDIQSHKYRYHKYVDYKTINKCSKHADKKKIEISEYQQM